MNEARKKFLIIASVLLVAGVLAIVLQPGPPAAECVADGAPASGFVDSETGCRISQESFAEIADYETSPKPFRIAGVVLILAAVGVAAFGLTRKSPSPGNTSV